MDHPSIWAADYEDHEASKMQPSSNRLIEGRLLLLSDGVFTHLLDSLPPFGEVKLTYPHEAAHRRFRFMAKLSPWLPFPLTSMDMQANIWRRTDATCTILPQAPPAAISVAFLEVLA